MNAGEWNDPLHIENLTAFDFAVFGFMIRIREGVRGWWRCSGDHEPHGLFGLDQSRADGPTTTKPAPPRAWNPPELRPCQTRSLCRKFSAWLRIITKRPLTKPSSLARRLRRPSGADLVAQRLCR